MNNKFFNVFKKKWLRDNAKTTVLIIIIVALYLGIAFWMNNTTFPELDLTKSNLHSLSDTSISKIKNIDREVKITFVDYGSYGYLIDFARKYGLENKNISVESVEDRSTRPDLVQEYGLADEGSIIIFESGENKVTLSPYDLYTYDYNTYEEINRTEEAFTNAILNVATDVKPKVYFMTGHNYYPMEYFNTLVTEIEANANEVDTIDLVTVDAVPADCDTLVITTLAQDIIEKERDILLSYVDNGGNILAFIDPKAITGVDTPNLNIVLAKYGVSVADGIVIEQSVAHMFAGSPMVILADVVPYGTLNQGIDMEMKMCAIYAGKLDLVDESKLEELGVEYENFATTSEYAFLKTNMNEATFSKTSSDISDGVIPIGSLLTKKISDEKTSKLIIFSSSVFIRDEINKAGEYYVILSALYNNMDMVLNSVSYLNEKEDLITIRKADSNIFYAVTEQQHRVILLIIIFVPVLIIFIGIVVWAVRRRKR